MNANGTFSSHRELLKYLLTGKTIIDDLHEVNAHIDDDSGSLVCYDNLLEKSVNNPNLYSYWNWRPYMKPERVKLAPIMYRKREPGFGWFLSHELYSSEEQAIEDNFENADLWEVRWLIDTCYAVEVEEGGN
jgi:hypothetical protein